MPDSGDSAVYWQRAAAWRERAHLLAEADSARNICLRIAADYESLAWILEERERLVKAGAGTAPDA